MLWLAGGFFLFLRWIAKKIKSRYTWWLPFALLTLAVTAFAFAPVPFTNLSAAKLLAWIVGWLFGLLGAMIKAPSAVIAAVLLACLVLAGLVDLFKDHKPDGWAKTMVYAAPVLALVASGPIASHVLELAQMLGGVGPTVINALS